jgi:hypothetical protein
MCKWYKPVFHRPFSNGPTLYLPAFQEQFWATETGVMGRETDATRSSIIFSSSALLIAPYIKAGNGSIFPDRFSVTIAIKILRLDSM